MTSPLVGQGGAQTDRVFSSCSPFLSLTNADRGQDVGSSLSSSTCTETPSSSIHTCNETMLLVVVSKVRSQLGYTLIGTPPLFFNIYIYIHNQSWKLNIVCTPRHFFFFLSQTTIICFKSKSSFLTSLRYSKDALGYKAWGGGWGGGCQVKTLKRD